MHLQNLTLDPHLNILVGVNGAGKTTVLNAIAILMSCQKEPAPIPPIDRPAALPRNQIFAVP